MRLVHALTETQTAKTQHRNDEISGAIGSSAVLSDQLSSAKPPPLSQDDYPLVKYWEKKAWKSVSGTRKDTSEVQTTTSSRGGTRSSKGENVMMLYIEDANGLPVDGNIASDMRDFARCIWRSLYERGLAPSTWGQATMQVRDEFCREMEREYPVLRFCDNHWKANALATAIYSQWYSKYDGPPRKKARTMTIVDDDTHFTEPLPEPEAHIDDDGKFLNAIPADANYSTEMSQSNSDSQGHALARPVREPECVESNASSTHHGVALKDPLCVMRYSITIPLMSEISSSNIFSQPASQFQVLESVPDVIQQSGSTFNQHNTSQITNTAAAENTDQTTDAHINALAPEVSNVNILPQTASGSHSTSTSTPADVSQTGNPTPTPPHTGTPDPTDAATSAIHLDPARTKELYQKRYQHKTKMQPGISVTAR
jgi:hypothetical protein